MIGVPLESARKKLSDIGCAPLATAPTEVIAGMGNYSLELVKELGGGVRKTRIAKAKKASKWRITHFLKHIEEYLADCPYCGIRARSIGLLCEAFAANPTGCAFLAL